MSDSGKAMGECKHRNIQESCVFCQKERADRLEAELLTRLPQGDSRTCQHHGYADSCSSCLRERVRLLTEEVARLKAGDFTPEEFQGLCHHLDVRWTGGRRCTKEEFDRGCLDYQAKLFGEDAERAEVDRLKRELTEAIRTVGFAYGAEGWAHALAEGVLWVRRRARAKCGGEEHQHHGLSLERKEE